MGDRITIGTLDELRRTGLPHRQGRHPADLRVLERRGGVRASTTAARTWASRCTGARVESGLLTCHWHNARFDLSSGGTLDPWADDVRAYPVEIDDGQVTVIVDAEPDRTGHLFAAPARRAWSRASRSSSPRPSSGCSTPACRRATSCGPGVDFGTRYRDGRLGRRPHRAHGHGQRARPTSTPDDRRAGARPRPGVRLPRHPRPAAGFPLLPARRRRCPADRLGRLVPPLRRDPVGRRRRAHPGLGRRHASAPTEVADIMFAAVTDHVFIDGGHTIDFTNKAFEVLDHLGWDAAADGAPHARRPDRGGQPQRGAGRLALPPRPRRHDPHAATAALPERLAAGPEHDGFDHDARRRRAGVVDPVRGPGRGRRRHRRRHRRRRHARGARPGRRLRRGAADHPLPHPERPRRLGRGAPRLHRRQRAAPGDPARRPSPALLRGVYHGALRIYLDRFLNVPAARLPGAAAGGRPSTSPSCRRAGTRRAASTRPAPSSTATSSGGGDPARGRSPRSATPC